MNITTAPPPAIIAQAPIADKVEALLAQMTLSEKVGQMAQLADGAVITGPGGVKENLEEAIRAGRVGSILNAVGNDRIRALQRVAVEESRLKIPILFGLDVIHGYKTIFPIPLAEACSWDLKAMEQSAHIAATEAAAHGIHWTFAPMVDIARDPRWGRIAEGAGEDPFLGGKVAAARVHGFQGPDLKAGDSVIACIKHFAGYGAALAGRDYNTVDLSQRALHQTYLPPYKAGVDAGARTVMTAFNEHDGTPCTANSYLLEDVLRKQWGFTGFVVSDWASAEEMINHGSAADRADVARQAANAGLSMEMASTTWLDNLAAQVEAGKVPMKKLDDAVRAILRVKFEKGLFENPYPPAAPSAGLRRQEAREIARKSIVLLKNEGATLPLAPGRRIALVGPLADDRKNMLGTWAGLGVGEDCRSVLDGFKARQVDVVYAKGCDVEGADRSGFAAAVQAARGADIVVAVLGESNDMSGEASSRANPELPKIQKELLAELRATGKPIALVLVNGRPLILEEEHQAVAALVEAWQLGTEAGPAITDVLLGDYNPSGKLVATFPRSVGQIPLFYSYLNTGRPYDAKNHFTTHYRDVPNTPLYPFGHGLSYTTFTYAPVQVSSPELKPGETLKVTTTLTNSGGKAGEETAQLYVRDLVGSVNRPVRELKGFQKVQLEPGQSKTVTFELSARDLAFYRKDMSFGAEAGEFKVFVGTSSATENGASFRLTAPVDARP